MTWYNNLIDWLEKHQLSCAWKSTFGIECPGCGFQRAFILLLKGKFIESFLTYPALVPIIIMFFYLFLHIKFNFKNGHKLILAMFITNVVIIVVSYIIKFIHYH